MTGMMRRTSNYERQNQSAKLTPAQTRRLRHKEGHQSDTAAYTRGVKANGRAELRERRQARLAGLLGR